MHIKVSKNNATKWNIDGKKLYHDRVSHDFVLYAKQKFKSLLIEIDSKYSCKHANKDLSFYNFQYRVSFPVFI